MSILEMPKEEVAVVLRGNLNMPGAGYQLSLYRQLVKVLNLPCVHLQQRAIWLTRQRMNEIVGRGLLRSDEGDKET